MMQQFDVVVLGAGAAGMMAALTAGRRGRRVLLLEHNDRVGRKILISGGGRCNFTNVGAKAENYLSENVHFAKSAMARYTPRDFIALVEKHGIAYHEKTLGQLFCDGSAQQIVAMLEKECREAGVETRVGVKVHAVAFGEGGARFVVATTDGEVACESVIVATGGLSIPKMGATGFGYDVARKFEHNIVEPRAALVPLVFAAEDRERWCDLAGVSAEVIATAQNAKRKPSSSRKATAAFREKMLVTHRGLSGPVVLQISSYWRPGVALRFDLAAGVDVFGSLLERSSQRDWNAAFGALRAVVPTRLAERWIRLRANVASGDWTNAGIARLEEELHAWTLTPAGTEGFEKAEVTAGGVDTAELDARTMESGRVPGLYFIGEVVDVTGWLGGYNFQWAWASGTAAGQSA